VNQGFISYLVRDRQIDLRKITQISLIQESPTRAVRMANLASLGSKKINGVAKLHSDLLKQTVLAPYYELFPEKFLNVTNGVTPRRFIQLNNPNLSDLITEAIGDKWKFDLNELKNLEKFSEDASFVKKFQAVKKSNKDHYYGYISENFGLNLDDTLMNDTMIKRIHEYKRQHLKILHIVTLYQQFLTGQLDLNKVEGRNFFMGGKAAAGYRMAKEIIKLAVSVSEKINQTPGFNEKFKFFFHPNYNVSTAAMMIPATDLSEQISQAGKEASGTSNMKFVMNGSLLVGTLDGANVEIREQIGDDNFFLFGLDVEGVDKLYKSNYKSYKYYESNPQLKAAIDLIASGEFGSTFTGIIDNLLNEDPFMVLADYQAYIDVQKEIDETYSNQDLWTKKTILSIARSGFFSSDRAIKEYNDKIWN